MKQEFWFLYLRNCKFDDLINIHQKISLSTKKKNSEKTVAMVTDVLLYEDNQVF